MTKRTPKPTGALRRFTITVKPDGGLAWRNQGLTRWEVLPVLAEVHAAVAKELNGEPDENDTQS